MNSQHRNHLTPLLDTPLVDRILHGWHRSSDEPASTERTAGADAAAPADAPLDRNARMSLAAVALMLTMTSLDSTVISVALPFIRSDLGGGTSSIQWIASVYMLVYAVVLIPAGRLVDLVGPRPVFVTGVAIYVGASVGAALGLEIWTVILGRAIQGAGAGIASTSSMILVTTTFGPERRGRGIGVIGSVLAAACAVGPIVGGAVTDTIGWRWIFVIHAVFAVGSLLLVRMVKTPTVERSSVDFDGRGVAALAGVVLGIQVAIIEGRRLGAVAIGALAVLVIVCCVLFVRVERDQREPLLDVSLLRKGPVLAAVVSRSIVGFAFFGMLFFLTLLLEGPGGFSAFVTGVILLPLSVLGVFASPGIGRLSDRFGPMPVMVAATCTVTAGLALIALLHERDDPIRRIAPGLVLIGLGYAAVSITAKTAPLTAVSDHLHGRVTSLVSVFTKAAAGFGVTFGTGLFNAFTGNGVDRALGRVDLVESAERTSFVRTHLAVIDLRDTLSAQQVNAAGFDDVDQAVVVVTDTFTWAFSATVLSMAVFVGIATVLVALAGRRAHSDP